MLEEEMLGKKVWAVVGANEDPDKFGNKIYRKLLSRGYTVYPVNPKYTAIEGNPCYRDLSSLPQKPDVIDMVISPEKGKQVLEEAARLGIGDIWFQPGTCNGELLEFAIKNGFRCVQACVLVALG